MVSNPVAQKGLAVRFGVVMALCAVMSGMFAGSAFAASATVRVEGERQTYFSGTTTLGTRKVVDSGGTAHSESSNALSALDTAAQLGGFPFVLDNTAYGLYVSSVGGELPDSNPPYPGWSYRVNGKMPSVGADKYGLKSGDDVLWYYGTWDASPTVAAVPSGYVPVNTYATVTAKQLNPSGVASVLGGATVNIGRYTVTSGTGGLARVKLTAPGNYGVRVSKDGYVRSAVGTIKVRYTTKFSSLKASKTKVKRGKKVTISGKLTGVGKTPAGKRVNLYSRKRGSSKWSLIAHKNTSSSGAFKFSVKVTKDRYYRTTFSGDSSFASATGSSLRVKVKK